MFTREDRDRLSGLYRLDERPQPIHAIQERGIEVRRHDTGEPVCSGTIDIGKRLRPSCRAGKIVLYVVPGTPPGNGAWQAIRLP
jgi:hypothetical protein